MSAPPFPQWSLADDFRPCDSLTAEVLEALHVG